MGFGDVPFAGDVAYLKPARVRCHPSDNCRRELLDTLELCDELDEVSTDTGAESDGSAAPSLASVAYDDGMAPLQVDPWDAYEEFAADHTLDAPAVAGRAVRLVQQPSSSDEVNLADIVPSGSEDEGGSEAGRSDALPTGDNVFVPTMPTVSRHRNKHRDKCSRHRYFPWNAAVARPVGKAEIQRTPKAKAAMGKEMGTASG